MSANKHIVGGKPTLRFLLDWYDVWLRQSEWEGAARALEVSSEALKKWDKAHKDLRTARELAAERRGKGERMGDYIFGHLSPEAQKVWEELQFWSGSQSASMKVEQIMRGKTTKLRQELFIHALVRNGFDLSAACHMVHVSRGTFESWRADPDFRGLVGEIQWHKKNFFEHAMLDLVAARHPAATIWANKTVNADRGYGDKIELEHSGQVDVGFSIDELDLDVSIRMAILEAIRRKKEEAPMQVANTNGNGHVRQIAGRPTDDIMAAIMENESED